MPRSKRFTSLRNKLVWPFALLGCSVSAILSLITLAIVADLEERGIERILLIELEDFRARKQRNPAALPINTRLIRGHFLPAAEAPELDDLVVAEGLPRPATRLLARDIEGRPCTVLVDEVDGDTLAIVHDDSGSRSMLRDLAWLMAAATGLMTLLSTLLGNRLAGQVARPISRLLVELDERSQHARWPDEVTPLFATGEYPSNEIGRLALALDAFAGRLHGFVLRERHFVADVSHELRTPIAIIRGTAEVARELPELPPALATRLDLIQRKAARLAELLDALLMLAREREVGRAPNADAVCALAEVVEESVAECRTLIADKPVNIVCEFSDRPLVPVERSMAYVVVSNLLRNACVHTRRGEVKVSLDGRRLLIEDTGAGIAADRFPHIFKRFEKGEDSPGAGIGLSIVARMSEVMGWRIEISSEPGAGTRVGITFGESERHVAAAREREKKPSGSRRV